MDGCTEVSYAAHNKDTDVFYVFLVFVVISIIRARQSGATWWYIFAWVSKYFNFLFGGKINETSSSRIGRCVKSRSDPIWFWLTCRFMLDCMFIWMEKDHCSAAANRENKITSTES